jgi:hypothetical protein
MNALLGVCLLLAAQDKPVEKPPAPPAGTEAKPYGEAPKPAAQEPPPKLETTIKSLANQITIGGQVRWRFEYRDPTAYNNLGATTKDDQREDLDVFLQRIRLNLTFTLNDQIEFFFQPQDQRAWGDEASVLSDETNLDVHQGFVLVKELLTPALSAKIGRQELSYGDQRLVSPLDWSNIGRAWDGAKLRYAPGDWWVEAFYTVIQENFNFGSEDDQDFWGFYASLIAVKDHEFDVYAFGRTFNANSSVGEPGADIGNDRNDVTYGLRLKGKMSGFDYTAEGMLQSGEVEEDDVKAWAFAATLGYTFDMDWKPRIGVEITHASGDQDGTDGDIETFDPLFPFGHFYQGFADVFSFRNGQDIAVYLRVAPTPTLSFHLDFHMFTLDQVTDAWYNFAGAPIRPGVAGADDEVGQEIDLHFRAAVGKHVKFWGGVSRFFAGQFVEDSAGATGIDGDMTWVFLQMTVDF